MTEDADDHPRRHGDDLAADEGRHPQHARSRARRSGSCGCAGSGPSRPRSWWRSCRGPRPSASSTATTRSARRSTRAWSPTRSAPPCTTPTSGRRCCHFICGLGGREVTLEDVDKATDMCFAAATSGQVRPQDALARRARVGDEITWLTRPRSRTRPRSSSRSSGVKRVTIEEYFTSGHRTCQGCESALVMKLMVKASGPRTIVLGSTGCMYVANTTYYTTPWVVPWMHTQLGSSGSAALGTAAGLKALMKQGQDEVGADQRHRLLRRRRRRRHGARRHLGDADPPRVQLADPAVRQRVVRQHRHPALRDRRPTAPTPRSARPARSSASSTRAGRRTWRACWPPATRSAATWPPCARPTRSR